MVLTNEELKVLIHELSRIAAALEDISARTKMTLEVLAQLVDTVGSTEDGRRFIRTRRK